MQIKFCIFVLAIFVLCIKADKYLRERPHFLTPCVLNDANFNKCLAHNFQGLLVEWKNGIPGTNILGPFDPLHIKRLKFNQDSNMAIAINADLKNVDVTGASQLIFKDANYNAKKYVAKALVFVPRIRFQYDYKVKGHVLALNLNGNGKGYFEAEKLTLILELGVKPRETPDGRFADVQFVKITFKSIENFHIELHNLFAGNKELEQLADTIFNDNWRQFYEILKPAAEQAMEAVILDRLKKTLNYVPATYFIENFR